MHAMNAMLHEYQSSSWTRKFSMYLRETILVTIILRNIFSSKTREFSENMGSGLGRSQR